MSKKSIILLLSFLFIASASAFTTTIFDYNSTKLGTNITNTSDLYAYEINFDYAGSSASIQQYNFLGSGSAATYGSNIKNNILSVYGSRLNASRIGVNSSGMLFNVSYSGSAPTLRYTLEIYGNGTETYVYYNNSCGDGTCADGETCSSCAADCGACSSPGGSNAGGSSGGGGAGSVQSEFTLNPSLLKVELIEGRTTREKIRLTNTKDEQIQIKEVSFGNLNQFVASYIPQAPFYIPKKDYIDMNIDFFARKDVIPDVYTGEIKFRTSQSTETLPVVLQVVPEHPLFDVVTALEKDEYSPGEMAMATIDIQNFGDKKDIDVIVHYAIKDFSGKELVYEEGSYAIENYKLQLIGKLRVPRDAAIRDKLIFYTQVTYPKQDVSASASSVFTVVQPMFSPLGDFANLFILILIPLAVVAIIIVTVVIIFNVTRSSRSPQPAQFQQPPTNQ